jgi:hypothetical protein
MNTPDYLRPGQQQQIVVAFQIMRMIGEACSAIVGFLQFVALNHRSHRAIKNEQALFQESD